MNERVYSWRNVATLLIGIVCFANAHAMQNEPRDFNGVPWGAAIDDHKQALVLVSGDDNFAHYRRAAGANTFAGIDAWRISYRFYKKRFSSATVTIVGINNFNSMLAHLTKTYGDPNSVNPRHRIYVWDGANAGVMTSCDISLSCYVEFYGKAMRDLEVAEQGDAPSKLKLDD
jgi:hypothetical protein